MKLSVISDMHGNLNFSVNKSDILLIAGDICPAFRNYSKSIEMQADWLRFEFKKWASRQPVKKIIFCPGNHDWIFEKAIDKVPNLGDNCTCLIDENINLLNLKIYGSPWQPTFYDWAFNLPENKLKLCWEKIPEDIDILLLHGPPYGIMDRVYENIGIGVTHIGSTTLLNKINQIKPKLVVFGHNHNEPGILKKDGIIFINATLLNDSYKMVNKPIEIEI